MHAIARRRARVFAAIAAVSTGCAGLAGVGNVTFDDAGVDASTPMADASSPDTSMEGSVALDGQVEAGVDVLVESATPCPSATATCAPAVPAGWQGPVAFSMGSGTPPQCGGSYATAALQGIHAGLDAGPASCAPCSCSAAPTGASCGLINVFFAPNPGCGGVSCNVPLINPGQCVTEANDECGFLSAVSVITPGNCGGGTGGAATVPSISWSASGAACSGSPIAAACAGGGVCMPDPPSGFTQGLCVYRAGELACPAAYPAPHVLYTGIEDTRGCTSCECAYDGNCQGTLSVYTDSTCGNAVASVPLSNGATSCLTVQGSYMMASTPTPTPNTCIPPGTSGQPSGAATVDAGAAVTVCCLGGG